MNEELRNLLKQIKDTWGRETIAAILVKMDNSRNGLNFNGTLRKSVSYEQQPDLDGDISFFMADYGHYLDQGVNGTRSAYSTQFKFSGDKDKIRKMGGALKSWADAKGLNPWALAHSMQKKGIQPRRFFDSVVEARLGVLGESITNGISEYLTISLEQQ